jgi:hypothetical protein
LDVLRIGEDRVRAVADAPAGVEVVDLAPPVPVS